MKTQFKDFYDWRDKGLNSENCGNIDKYFISVLPLFEINEKGKFLDIGCYDGAKTQWIAKYTKSSPFGLDFLEQRLQTAKTRGIHAKKFDIGSNKKIPYKSKQFDFIFCGDVIEHIFSPDHLLMEIWRLLKQNGYAIITTPNLSSWKDRISLLLGWQPGSTEVSTKFRLGSPRLSNEPPSGHIRVFTQRAIKEICIKYGFQVEKIKGGAPSLFRRGPTLCTKILDKCLLNLIPSLCEETIIKIRKKVSK